jgi:hypothetical protein
MRSRAQTSAYVNVRAYHVRAGRSATPIGAGRVDGTAQFARIQPDEIAHGAGVDDDVPRTVIPVSDHRRGTVRAGDAPLQVRAIGGRRGHAWRLCRAPARRQRDGEPAPGHENPLAALADLDRLAIVDRRAGQRLPADRTVVPAFAGDAQPVSRRLRTNQRGAMGALPAGARGMERHRGAAVGAVHGPPNSDRIMMSRGGGTGRRIGLKIRRSQKDRVGSIPTPGTIYLEFLRLSPRGGLTFLDVLRVLNSGALWKPTRFLGSPARY